MRFSTAWAKVAAQNVSLKIATVLLAIIATTQLGIIGVFSLKDPLVIERACYSKPIEAKAITPSQDEIKSFIAEVIPMRFDSGGTIKEGYLALEESLLRERELVALKQRQMTQRILISDIQFEGKDILITTDRLMSIGKVKSVLSLNLRAVVQQVSRSELNPYGLILSSVKQIEEKEDKK